MSSISTLLLALGRLVPGARLIAPAGAYGETVEVVKPAELRNSIRSAVASMARTYGTAPKPSRRPGRHAPADAVRTPKPR